MMLQHKSKLIFLRLVLGVEMLLSSIMFSFSHQWNQIFKTQMHVPIWAVITAMGGLWLFVSSLVALHNSDWNLHRIKEKRANDFLNRFATAEFFYCGAVWGGIWWESLVNPYRHFMDGVAPLNVAFLLLLAFKDAAVKRERAARKHEAARQISAIAPAHGMVDPVRVRAERVRGRSVSWPT